MEGCADGHLHCVLTDDIFTEIAVIVITKLYPGATEDNTYLMRHLTSIRQPFDL